jgi:hypothetical protein
VRTAGGPGPQRSRVVSYAIALFLLILVTMQLWLLTATMNAYLGGDESVIWPAAVASIVCFALAAGLLHYVTRARRFAD